MELRVMWFHESFRDAVVAAGSSLRQLKGGSRSNRIWGYTVGFDRLQTREKTFNRSVPLKLAPLMSRQNERRGIRYATVLNNACMGFYEPNFCMNNACMTKEGLRGNDNIGMTIILKREKIYSTII
jgi:hypothetical protein